jgi:hypothetical protein
MSVGSGIAGAPVAAPTPFPELDFRVEGAHAERHVAVPTLCFRITVRSADARPIRAVLLDTKVQIAARARGYDEREQAALADLFGTPERWGTTLRTLPWTRVAKVVPGFDRETAFDLPVPCTYDLDVIAARYLAGLGDGEIPLELLFSGTVFFAGEGGALQTARISWEKDAECRLPVSVWREAIDRHFPDAAWLRVGRETWDRLNAERARRGDADFEPTLAALLEERG